MEGKKHPRRFHKHQNAAAKIKKKSKRISCSEGKVRDGAAGEALLILLINPRGPLASVSYVHL